MNTEEQYYIYIYIYISFITLISLHYCQCILCWIKSISLNKNNVIIAQNHNNCLFSTHLKSLAVSLSFSVGLAPHDVIVGIYCGVIVGMFVLLKAVNYRLHTALDEGEVVELRAKGSEGRGQGAERQCEGPGTRQEDSNGPG